MKKEVKRINEKKIIDISQYHNSETGELLSSEMKKGTSIVVNEATSKVTIDYENYATVSTKAIMALVEILNNSDLANALKMSFCAKGPLSLLYNENNQLHSNKTLQDYLDISSESTYFILINKLIKAGVLYQIKGNIYGEVRKVYMLNPFLSKKRKTFDEEVIKIFKSFDQKEK
jgi:co-chaperonin GroES (HSP10)